MAETTTTPRRVLIAADYMLVGGAEQVTAQLARVLVAAGDDVRVHLMLGKQGSLRLPAGVEVSGDDDIAASMEQCAAVIRDWQPHVVVVNHSQASMGLVEVLRTLIPRVVVFVHAQTDWTGGFIAKHALVDSFLCVSAALCDWLLDEGVPGDKVEHFENAVDVERFDPQREHGELDEDFTDDDTGERLSQQLAALRRDGVRIIGWHGRVSEEKAPHLLVRAYRQLRRHGHRVRLVLLGAVVDDAAQGIVAERYNEWTRGEGEKLLEELAQTRRDELPEVIWTQSFVVDPAPWLQLFDVYAMSSRYEGLPLGLLEAMATGVPFVAPNVGDISALRGGVHFEPSDDDDAVRKLVEGLSLVLAEDELHTELARDARQHVVEHYSLAARTDSWRQLVFGQEQAVSSARQASDAPDDALPVCEGQGAQAGAQALWLPDVVRSVRPRVAMVYDSPGWSFHRIALQVQRHLADEYDVVPVPYWPPSHERIDCDICCALPYNAVEHLVRRLDGVPLVTCVYDQTLWTQHQSRWQWRMYHAAEHSALLLASSPHLHELLRGVFPGSRVGTCYDGVDVEHFVEQPWQQRRGLVVGWAGNADETYHGKTKGLHLLRKAVDALPFAELSLAERTASPVPYDEMPSWYRSIDVYVCMSTQEGTPNPVLEASASGRPWVSTDVGIVGQLNRTLWQQECGIIIKRETRALQRALERLNRDPALAQQLGAAGRRAAEQWSWREHAEQFRVAFRSLLG